MGLLDQHRIIENAPYREEFLKHSKPIRSRVERINGRRVEVRYYRCIHCGTLVPHYLMQVDHIIPKTKLWAGVLWDPNKYWNLGSSCAPCNQSKSNKLDIRVLNGFKAKYLHIGSRKIMDNDTELSTPVKVTLIILATILTILLSIFMPIVRFTTKFSFATTKISLKLIKNTIISTLALTLKLTFRTIPRLALKAIKHPVRTAAMAFGTYFIIRYMMVTGVTPIALATSTYTYLTNLIKVFI